MTKRGSQQTLIIASCRAESEGDAMRREELDTPALLLDLNALERNISKMSRFIREAPADLRPHVKTHKCPEIARRQIEAGAKGITCAKLGEAEAMTKFGVDDILIANQVVGKQKIKRLISLAESTHIMVAIDSIKNARELSNAAAKGGQILDVVVELNIGLNRCGAHPGADSVALAKKIVEMSGLNIRGLMGYEGHVMFIPNHSERKRMCEQALAKLTRTKSMLEKESFDVQVVSAGGTGTYDIAAVYPGITEVQAGSYATMDTKYRDLGVNFECALSLISTVISRPTEKRAVIDAGAKAITSEYGMPEPKEPMGSHLTALHEEHGILRLESDAQKLDVGDKIEFIVSHGCTTVNLHDQLNAMRGDRLEAVWSIAARGKFR